MPPLGQRQAVAWPPQLCPHAEGWLVHVLRGMSSAIKLSSYQVSSASLPMDRVTDMGVSSLPSHQLSLNLQEL